MAFSLFKKKNKKDDWFEDAESDQLDSVDNQIEPEFDQDNLVEAIDSSDTTLNEANDSSFVSETTPIKKTNNKKKKGKKPKKKSEVNPLEVGVGLFKRLIGDWPLFDAPPLMKSDLKRLQDIRPAFVDHFPFVDFDPKHRVFIMNDNISCGAAFDVIAPDLDARAQEDINEFCDQLNNALLSAIPTSDEAPYVMQVFLEDRQPKNIAAELRKKANKEMQNHSYGNAYFEAMEEHFEMMANPEGIFTDDRTTGESKGWRAIERKLTLVLFRKASRGIWNNRSNKRISTFEQFNRDIKAFTEGLNALDVRLTRYDESDLYEWLSPWFNPNPVGSDLSSVDWIEKTPLPKAGEDRGFAWDLAQIVCPEPPGKVDEEDALRGVMKFGEEYSRYISLEPIYAPPRQGCYTTDIPLKGDSTKINASIWDKMPSQTIQVWTVIPLSTHLVRKRLQELDERCNKDKTSSAKTLKKQIDPAQERLTVGTQRIFYYQVGVYVRANSVEQLDEKYHSAISTLQTANTMRPIREEHELFATDSYIRNIPFVFDWQHDRKHALRASMAYSSHVAATLPFYGRSRGSKNPCFVNYNRSGEVIRINPYHPEDKSRVAHSALFGPTGAGKSATQVSQSMASMVINFPRQFFVDKGGSFALLGDYYERLGLKVKRIYFQTWGLGSNGTVNRLSEFRWDL